MASLPPADPADTCMFAALVVDMVPISGRCRACGERFSIENYEFACPHCASTDIEMASGQELYFKQVEVG